MKRVVITGLGIVSCIGNDVDPRGNILTGSVMIDKMIVAGK